MPQPAVFFDRDGTLIRFRSVVSELQHMQPLATARSLRSLKAAGFLLIGITNQPAIEKGEVSLAIAKKLNEQLHKRLQKYGVEFDAIYTCPHRHATGCGCKKPQQGMIRAAQEDFTIDMKKSWLVGDTHTDMETGKRAKLKTILLDTGSRTKDRQYFQTEGTVRKNNLRGVVRHILKSKDRS